MKIVALSSSAIALPCLHFLHRNGMLAALVCPARDDKDGNELRTWAKTQEINTICLSQTDLAVGLKSLIATLNADLVITCTFPYKIPQALLDLPPLGFINVHFSKLPAYRGPSPVFWQIRNGESTTGISIHRMDGGWDTGEVLSMLEVPIFPGETTGLCTARLSQLAVGLLKQLLQDNLTPVNQALSGVDSYYPKPDIEAMCIDWNVQTALEIENLVNACNPHVEGAITSLNQQPVQIVEVSPADLPEPSKLAGGSIIHASIQDGIFVVCADGNALRINIVKTREGIISGAKLAALGIKQGMQFTQVQQHINVINHNIHN